MDTLQVNRIKGEIENIEVSGSLSIATVKICTENRFKSIVIETPNTATYLKAGHQVFLLFKETEVILGIDPLQLNSIENQIKSSIKHIEKGRLLSKITLNTSAGEITSVISSGALHKLNLQLGQNVIAMVKINEIMLSE